MNTKCIHLYQPHYGGKAFGKAISVADLGCLKSKYPTRQMQNRCSRNAHSSANAQKIIKKDFYDSWDIPSVPNCNGLNLFSWEPN